MRVSKRLWKHFTVIITSDFVMSKTKIDFIADLLSTKKLDTLNKDRLFLLLANELKENGLEFDKIWEEIERLKKGENKNDDQEIHNPKNTINFLYRFSLDEQFKWFTHFPDSAFIFDYESSIGNAKKEFGDLEKTKINNNTYWNTRNFLFGNNDPNYPAWELFDNIKMNFCWKNVRDWCKEHYGEYPRNFVLPKENKYPDNFNKNFILLTFGDVIKEFKHNIEIRNDDLYRTFDISLKSLINRVGLNTDFNVIYEDNFKEIAPTINIYTDVNLLFKGLKQIFQWCLLHKKKSNEIGISIKSESEYYELAILHKNSYISFEPRSKKINGLGGELKKVRDFFFCICDWEMHARLTDGKSYKIEYLNNNINKVEQQANIKEAESAEGVLHSIRLYKTVNL